MTDATPSDAPANANANADANADDKPCPRLSFPPWPHPPPGATIPVWSEFKSLGIRPKTGNPDAPEVDGRGNPTIRIAPDQVPTKGDSKVGPADTKT